MFLFKINIGQHILNPSNLDTDGVDLNEYKNGEDLFTVFENITIMIINYRQLKK